MCVCVCVHVCVCVCVATVVATSSHCEWLNGSLETDVAVLKERALEITLIGHKRHPSSSHVNSENVTKL